MRITEKIKEKQIKKRYNEECVDCASNQNVILAKDILLSIDTQKTRRNLNTFIVGGMGSGPSRCFVEPNLLQANTSFIVLDVEGDLLRSTGPSLEKMGYKIKALNLVDMASSYRYNPFHYIHKPDDVFTMVECITRNFTVGHSCADEFFIKIEKTLLQALCLYVVETTPKENQTFSLALELLDCLKINEENPNDESEIDKMFKEYKKQNPDSLAVKRYELFKTAAGKNLKAAIISCKIRLTPFRINEFSALMSSDTLELEKLGEEKTALFCVISAFNEEYTHIVPLLYEQAFNALYRRSEKSHNRHRLPVHVRFFCNSIAKLGGTIYELDKKIAVSKGYDISYAILTSNIQEFKYRYSAEWESIMGNCDSILLFGSGAGTNQYFADKFKDEKIICIKNTKKHVKQNKILDILEDIDDSYCLCFVRGFPLFYGKKYNL